MLLPFLIAAEVTLKTCLPFSVQAFSHFLAQSSNEFSAMARHPFADLDDRGTNLEGTIHPSLEGMFWHCLPRNRHGQLQLSKVTVDEFRTHVEHCLAEIQVAECGSLSANKLMTTIILKAAALEAVRTAGDPRDAMRSVFQTWKESLPVLEDDDALRFRMTLYDRGTFAETGRISMPFIANKQN